MKEELYDDVMKEEPEFGVDKKTFAKFDKRLRKSIGWIDFHNVEWKRKHSNIVEFEAEYDVGTGDGGMAFEDEEHARIYAEVVQINKRLKRMEDAMKRKA